MATHPDAILLYAKSDMILGIHSDASYLSKPKARSHAGGHFFLSNGTDKAPNNGTILNISQIIKSVMSSAAEAELGALYINAREAVPCRTLLHEMGHPQPPTPIQNSNQQQHRTWHCHQQYPAPPNQSHGHAFLVAM
jgi:hypothetical protein